VADTPRRQLIVTELKKITSGERNGKPYTLSQVRATYPDGRTIENMELRTLENPPLNQVLTVEVEKYESPQWGVSYTLWLVGADGKRISKRGSGGGGGGSGSGLGASLDSLRKRFEHLLAWAQGHGYQPPAQQANGSPPEPPVTAPPPTAAPPAGPPPTPVATAPPAAPPVTGPVNPDDIPF
jgi:hypothetical protein